ncbi:hypothetical protein [Protofrankia symbiont of Coriaria ruscifolia]|uniref:nSTAND1 domain-containing NTPase n=1 Tax=Protofrankia symbiont of Coriaria ruscifolia TaxID=1306542 RepID=UPI003D6C8041
MVLVGSSGVGRSSILHAGLLAGLDHRHEADRTSPSGRCCCPRRKPNHCRHASVSATSAAQAAQAAQASIVRARPPTSASVSITHRCRADAFSLYTRGVERCEC